MEIVEPLAINIDLGDMPWNFMEKLRRASDKPKEGIQATIFRVPENIRRTNVDSFEPKMFSLGPYHHGKQLFQATDERIKLPCASNFFRGAMIGDLQRIVVQLKDWESDLRCAYSEQISMSSDEFVEMMLLDCAFMAEFLRERCESIKIIKMQEGGPRIEMEEYSWKWAAPSIINDMLVVENQFPLRPLLYLFEKCGWDDIINIGGTFYSLMQQIHRNLSPTWRFNLRVRSDPLIDSSSHLLHLFHSSLIIVEPRYRERRLHNTDLSSFPSAEMLQAMRIQFTNKINCESFLDITFDASKRSMEIPQFLINDDNISLLRNLIAFEQQCRGVGYYISTYVWFMDCLINTDRDVAVLRKHNIIVSRLRSDEEVAHIFNQLRRTDAPVVDFDNFYLAEVMINVKSHCRNRTNILCALWNFSWLKQNYFKNRWVTIGVTAAVFFNLLTLVQTVYAVLSYAKQ
ncbi:UPF0481 protein At3g47200-like [Zingiber officinale]|uniref:Uncharacterized protein n=1 Tax=Zingiber officinale TaxID=94328 RepID=A0A8J5HD49_ZINOF|nr:UPF0481 protein At3g47200-like [Zingiber officinale]XP_042373403.1 UPF0481 protein At3g47200-like [Zingiber officinale]KAG6519132.1 hypothetical protein ZIOFF_022621 [Zingiber officinale]